MLELSIPWLALFNNLFALFRPSLLRSIIFAAALLRLTSILGSDESKTVEIFLDTWYLLATTPTAVPINPTPAAIPANGKVIILAPGTSPPKI